MADSTHKVEVVRVGSLTKHPNADTLDIVTFSGFPGYTVISKIGTWNIGDLGAYIQPDSLVPIHREEFSFLEKEAKDGYVRIRVKKLRGIFSQGLLVPIIGFEEGADVVNELEVKHYDPPESGGSFGRKEPEYPAPPGWPIPVYDVEAFRKYGKTVFQEGEEVLVTEKLHGTSARFCIRESTLHIGSRKQWRNPETENLWARIPKQYPDLEYLVGYLAPGVVYGEIYGWVQDLRYGHKPGEYSLAIFDALVNGAWVDSDSLANNCGVFNVPMVPIIYSGPFNFELMLELAEGPSKIPGADHVREGVVIRPRNERWDPCCGRVVLKVVGNGYLERAK
jgi:RNA ligase (TIGR02306 family)